MSTLRDKKIQGNIDAVTASVIQGALENIAIEMGHKLMRMSYSSIIRESEDFGAALTDAEGRQIAETPQSTPLQSGPIPGYVKGIKQIFEERGDTFAPGDVIIHNSAYHGASHGPDVAFCVPVYYDGELVGFSVTTAHHLDIGALTPGSCGIVDAIDAYAEGLQFLALKIIDQGVRNEPLWQMLRNNIRTSDLVVGDMDAQIAAARIGADRLVDLLDRYGAATISATADFMMDHSESMMRQAITQMPDGQYTATTHVDGFTDSEDPARRDLPITVTLTVKDSDITVDFSGTADQVADRPINMPMEGTTDCAVWLTLKSILLDSDIYGNVPQNSGMIRPITIVAPEGSLVNPVFPAPTIARFCTGNQAADTVMKALAQAVPDKVSAGVGNLHVVSFSGLRGGDHWVHMEIHEGSYGGRLGKDGMDAVDTLYANTRNNPIEDMESHLPLRVLRYELRDDACPPGRWRGGIGSVREVEFLEDGGVSVEGEGHIHAPWGFDGGNSGETAHMSFHPVQGNERRLPSKLPNLPTRAGDRIEVVGPSGGGYGNPFERDPDQVCDDVVDGYLTAERALADYGVVITEEMTVDDAATATARARQNPEEEIVK